MLHYTLTHSSPKACHELVALQGGAAALASQSLPREPGAVRYTAGRVELLHFAPGRWLVPEPEAALLGSLARLDAATLIDVEGKWQRLTLGGPDAARVLKAAIPLESMLTGRECAATTAFDCPVVIARTPTGFDIWVLASYADALAASIKAVGRGSS